MNVERRFQRIYEIGCLACRQYGHFNQPCQVHHLNLDQHAGQLQLGDEHTIGLCEWHHQGQPRQGKSKDWMTENSGPSMFHESVRFREVFGSDAELLALQNELIDRREQMVAGRIAC